MSEEQEQEQGGRFDWGQLSTHTQPIKYKDMKQLISLIILLAFAFSSQSQQTTPDKVVTSDFLLKKGKRQSTAAWILLGGGVALVGTALLIGDSEESSFDDAATGGVIAGVGILSALGSIPLFIASSKNKRKAMNMTGHLKLERYYSPTGGISSRPGPAIAIRVNL